MTIEMSPDSLVADYAGEPGQRTFFLQARGDAGTFTYLLEKQQIAVLAEKLREILGLLDSTDPVLTATPARDPEMQLEAPIEPEWRVGTMGLSYDEETEEVIVALQPVQEGEEGEEFPTETEVPEEFAVRLRLSVARVRAFVLHAIAVVAEGRPTCQLCGLPMDPDGHNCPASNGHRAQV